MAFKSLKNYNEERFNGWFLLRNDGDWADVIFMYRSFDDVLIADTHYIKSSEYSGYVQCVGKNCPACGKGIRVQSKLFIPLYNLSTDQIEFWDRNIRFENQLSQDVFEKYPNPSDFVFRITRHGNAGDINTTYQIQAVGRNTQETYDQILSKKNIKLPDYYETVCKDYSASELASLLASSATPTAESAELPDYSVTPRKPVATGINSSMYPASPDVVVESSDTPTEAATMADIVDEIDDYTDVSF